MDLLSVVITLIIIGVLLWVVFRYVPLQPPIPTIILAVVVLAVVLWLLRVFGVMGRLSLPG
jgi:hypothetical protein